jgi:hypothetical protein
MNGRQMKARLTLIVARALVVVLALSGPALAATSPLVSALPCVSLRTAVHSDHQLLEGTLT